jgi:O-acetyl-ADP-ribose deacetylase (regulator of RNase III)
MKIIKGDLVKLALEGHFDVIVHGCNCQGVMNSGIARQIRINFPNAYEQYKYKYDKGYLDPGVVIYARHRIYHDFNIDIDNMLCSEYQEEIKSAPGDNWLIDPNTYTPTKKIIVCNALTQKYYGGDLDVCYVDYNAIRECFKKIKSRLTFSGYGEKYKIAYPKIGAGLGGGDWDIISKIIDEELEGLDHTLVIYDKE